MSRNLQILASAGRAPSVFAKHMLDLVFSRYFVALHVPFFSSAFTEPVYAFSRKTVVEMSLKAYYCARPQIILAGVSSSTGLSATTSPSEPPPPSQQPTSGGVIPPEEEEYYARLSITGGGFFRYIPHQASVFLALELLGQLQDDVALGAPTARPDLLNGLHDATRWARQRIHAGETNIKGYLLTVALKVQVDASLRGQDQHGCEQEILTYSLQHARECLEIFKQAAADTSAESAVMDIPSSQDAALEGEEWDTVGILGASVALLAIC